LAITPAPIFVYSNLIVGSNYQLQESVAWYWTNQSASFTATNSIYQQVPPAGAGISGVASYRLTRLPVPAQAFAVAVLDYGFFVAANITSTGSGYVTSPTVAIVGGGGANAGATAQISGGLVTGITVTNPGFGYTNPPSVEIAPPPAVAINPMATLEMRLDSTNLIPYENYQIQFDTGLENSWANLLTFAATAPTNSQYLVVSNNVALFRLEHHQ